MLRRLAAIAVPALIVLVAVGAFVLYPRAGGSVGDRVAFFDSLENGDEVTIGQVLVIAGATDPNGVSVLEFEVDGEFVEGRLFDGAPERVVAEFAWLPNVEGDYWLSVRARGKDGVWGVSETIKVSASYRYASDEALRPPTTSPSQVTSTTAPPASGSTTSTTAPPANTSTTVPASTTTTVATCERLSPVLSAPADGSVIDDVMQLKWGYADGQPCTPDGVIVHLIGATELGEKDLQTELPPGALSWRPPRLRDCTDYQWTVTAVYGNVTKVSQKWAFSTDFKDRC